MNKKTNIRNNKYDIFIKLAVCFIFIFTPILFIGNSAQAWTACKYKDGAIYYGRDRWCGYFYNYRDQNWPKTGTGDSSQVLPILANNLALPSSGPYSINTVAQLIALLKQYNISGVARKVTGSSFIVNTMLGRNGSSNGGKIVSETDWNTLTARLTDRESKNKIVWSTNVSGSRNSYYQGVGSGDNPQDDAFYVDSKSEAGIVIKNDDNAIVYQLLRRCANPIGSLPGLPVISLKNYTLTPSVTTNSTVIEAGAKVTVSPAVTNVGEVTSNPTGWSLTRTPPSSAALPSGSGALFAVGNTPLPNYVDSDTDLPAGTRICYVLSVTPHSNVDAGTIASASACVVVGKKPKIQIWGGDLMAGGLVTTSSSVKNIGGVDRTFGSWAEYGILATGIIKGMASGSAFAGPGLANPTVCKYSTLSFTNAGSSTSCEVYQSASTTIGGYVSTRSLPDVAASFPIISTTPNVVANLSGLPSGTYTASGNVSLSGGNIEKSQYVVINAPSATITIAGNINYTNGTLQKLSDIPQVIIIANKIVINGSVTNVDAWLIAKNSHNTGEIYTCEILGDTINKCNKPLVVNGPVMTNKLFLRRTGGSGAGAASGDPAEVFNLRPDAYLWAFSRAATNGRIRTVYTTELPPRL